MQHYSHFELYYKYTFLLYSFQIHSAREKISTVWLICKEGFVVPVCLLASVQETDALTIGELVS